MKTQERIDADDVPSSAKPALKVLTAAQIRQIDEMLSKLGPFGELHLVKKQGHLRFIEKVESFEVDKA